MGQPALSFSALTRDDFALLVSWLAEPHVARWWPPQSADQVEREYGPSVDGSDPTRVFICHLDANPVAMVQTYRLSDHPDYERAVDLAHAAGIDLLVGDASRCGVGLGPRIIAGAASMIWDSYPEVTMAMAGPSVHNHRSIRAFEKAGFVARGPVRVPDEVDLEMILVCPRPTATG